MAWLRFSLYSRRQAESNSARYRCLTTGVQSMRRVFHHIHAHLHHRALARLPRCHRPSCHQNKRCRCRIRIHLILRSRVGTTDGCAAAESQKLAMLQSAAFPSLASEISPDDTTVLNVTAKPGEQSFSLSFVNIMDGSTSPVSEQARDLPPFSEVRWHDGRTVVYVSLDFKVGPVIVTLDRVTGALRERPIKLKGFPLSLAPNGSRLLMALRRDTKDDEAAKMQSPFDITLKRAPDDRIGLARCDADR